jgi:hypothetical protein
MGKKAAVLICAALVGILVMTACGSTSTAVVVNGVRLAKNLDANYQVIDPTTQFFSTDTIKVSVALSGSPSKGVINGKFFYGEQSISEVSLDLAQVNLGNVVRYGGNSYVAFNLAPSQPWPLASNYRFELYVDGKKIGDYTYAVIQ